MKKIVLYGAGGFAKEVISIIDAINRCNPTYDLIGLVVDDEYYLEGRTVRGYDILGTRKWLLDNKSDIFCNCVIANIKAKAQIQEELSREGVAFESIIHPSVNTKNASIGKGCVFYPGVTISTDCIIGDGVLINTYTTIGHDAKIGNYSTIMPGCGISGNCDIGKRVMIGGHSFIVERKKIGNDATVAAGSIVFCNVKANTTVIGNPAKRIKAIERK